MVLRYLFVFALVSNSEINSPVCSPVFGIVRSRGGQASAYVGAFFLARPLHEAEDAVAAAEQKLVEVNDRHRFGLPGPSVHGPLSRRG